MSSGVMPVLIYVIFRVLYQDNFLLIILYSDEIDIEVLILDIAASQY